MNGVFEIFGKVHQEHERKTTHIQRMDDLSIKNISDMPDYTRDCTAYSDVITHVSSPVQITTFSPGGN
jgi:hypothetical protein